jgi:hypothetical protein
LDGAGEAGVGVQFLFVVDEVVVGFGSLDFGLPVLPIITTVDRKIASRDTKRVRVGHGLFSNTIIQTANNTACR